MSPDTPAVVHLKDYLPPPWLIDTVVLDVNIRRDETIVTATLGCARNPARAADEPLLLDGVGLETLSVSVDGKALDADAYALKPKHLVVHATPDVFMLQTVVRVHPEKNTELCGLYRSHDGYFTQCEAQGFRRITWFADRPDVMSRYTVTIHADRTDFPFLLSNGNPVSAADEAQGRHTATWHDPFKKPCYLFALVAGKLDVLRDTYRTTSGRNVQLAIYVEPGKIDQCAHAMDALKKSMRWDEDTFGLECDLDHYMIVAVGDFNMGAMENKGLNVFNTKYVLARADVATDTDFENIDRVVAHEYFHNWTGNRVTCRDWFQLSLKEGLTVFRDQEFGADTHSRQTARIREVRGLRAAQFPEDAGPLAHPVRPESYLEINNFYTATVYEKGAEVVRMIHTLIGGAAFRRGMDLYFERHDGHAVTCDDFVAAMADASGFDFSRFMSWYSRAGTPRVAARGTYDAAARRYTLTLSQSLATANAEPYLIPVAVGLVGPQGGDLDLGKGATTTVLQLTESEQTFSFENIPAAPVPSLLRNFSAPVILDYAYGEGDLAHLLAHDSDPFNRWEAGQRLFGSLIVKSAESAASGRAFAFPEGILTAAREVLLSASDPAFVAEALTLPGETTLAEQMEVVDPDALHAARNALARGLAASLEKDLLRLYGELSSSAPYRPDTAGAGRRRLRNLCLALLGELPSEDYLYRTLAVSQFERADNMTDEFAALAVLANARGDAGESVLAAFYDRWQNDALVVDKWLAVQASSRLPGTLARVEALTRHSAFDLRNPNKVYALLRSFGANHVHFHAADGAGYRFLGEQIAAVDAINAQVAARLARSFDRWRRFDATRQGNARAALETLRDRPCLSRDVFEVVDKALV